MGETYSSSTGKKYAVTRAPNIDTTRLPQNTDLKMADGDLARYAAELCGIEAAGGSVPNRCEVYVQPSRDGSLIGYAALVQHHDGATVLTATSTGTGTDDGKMGRACSLEGRLYTSAGSREVAVLDITSDFEARILYSAWEKYPGEYLVSQVEPDGTAALDDETALGVWYITRKGTNLRISQERWNYCYEEKSIVVDEAFDLLITLVPTA